MKKNKRPSQCKRLIKYLSEHPEGITQKEADKKLGISRLPARISEMKKSGFVIDREMVNVLNRYGQKCRVARYRLIE